MRETFQERLELKLSEKPNQFISIGLAQPQIFQIHVYRRVGLHRGQLFGQQSLLLLLFQDLPVPRFHLVQVLVDLFQASKRLEQIDSALGPDALDPGDVVHRITGQTQVVRDLLRPYAQLFRRRFHGDHFRLLAAGLRVVDPDAVAHELHQVFVAGHDRDVQPLFGGAFRQRGDHVVGLVAR